MTDDTVLAEATDLQDRMTMREHIAGATDGGFFDYATARAEIERQIADGYLVEVNPR